jgi:hypothetical protein
VTAAFAFSNAAAFSQPGDGDEIELRRPGGQLEHRLADEAGQRAEKLRLCKSFRCSWREHGQPGAGL